TLSEADSTGSGAGSIGFNYSAADATFDFLASGQTLTITYNLTVTGNNGASSTQPVVITVIGTALVIGPGQTLTLSGDTLTNPFLVHDRTLFVHSNLSSPILAHVPLT